MRSPRNDQRGDSLLSIGLAMVIIVLFSLLSINTFLAGQSNNTNTSTSTQAYLLGYTLLQQQTVSGCGTATSSQTAVTSTKTSTPSIAPNSVAVAPTTADTLTNILYKCQYRPEKINGALVYSAPTKLPLTPTCSSIAQGFLADTPWVCIVYNNVTYQARLQNRWVANSASATPCTPTPSVTPPTAKGLERTVSLVWYNRGTYFHHTFSKYFPVPSDVPSASMPSVGGVVVYDFSTATIAEQGVSMKVTYTVSSSSTTSSVIDQYVTGVDTYILFPYIPATTQTSSTVTMFLGASSTPKPVPVSPHKLLCEKAATI